MKVAIVGSANSRSRAPYDDADWQIWAHACAHKMRGVGRVDRWFDIHIPAVRDQVKGWDADYPAWLRGDGRDGVIVIQPPTDGIANAMVYPRADVEAWLRSRGGLPGKAYFTSSLAWMVALALYEGATHISLWGITFAQKYEYVVQRPCAEYWIGFARALGVSVEIAKTSPLCRSGHVYGYGGPRPDLKKDVPYAPRPLMLVGSGGQLPELMAVPPEVQQLIDEQRDLYELTHEGATHGSRAH